MFLLLLPPKDVSTAEQVVVVVVAEEGAQRLIDFSSRCPKPRTLTLSFRRDIADPDAPETLDDILEEVFCEEFSAEKTKSGFPFL